MPRYQSKADGPVHNAMHGILALVVITIFGTHPALVFANSPEESVESAESAESHLEFVTDFGANCVARSAKQILIQNHHPSKAIKIKLIRFFGGVRQPGRAVYTLAPGEEPLALGCDKIQGRVQRWDIHKAEFK